MRLDVSRVSFGYPESPQLLQDISFVIEAGHVLCILGPNGAGKTTLLRCVLGMCRFAGQVRVDGQDITMMSRRALARTVAYVPQSHAVPFPFQVFDMVLMGRTPHIDPLSVAGPEDEARAHAALATLGIARLAERSFHEISGGERQLVLIARALCQDARLLIMDEPTASLDHGNQIRVLRMVGALRESGYAVVMTAHNPDHAFLAATDVAILTEGHITAVGVPGDVITSHSLTQLYATPIRVIRASLPDDPPRSVTACVPLL